MNIPGTTTTTGCPTPRGTTITPEGERRWLPCGRLVCCFCGPATALKTVSAIRLAAPDRAGYVSLPPSRLSTPELRASAPLLLRTAIGRIARDVLLSGKTWEHVSVVELSTSGSRPHAHFLQRGDPIDSRELRMLAARHDFGWAELSPIRHLAAISRYILKVPIGALDLDAEQAVEVLELHKHNNGGKLLSSTARFWRAPGYPEIHGVRAARAVAYRAWRAKKSRDPTRLG